MSRVWHNPGWRTAIITPLWLVLIAVMHQQLNAEEDSERKQITMGYMPVVTNLAAPILDYASKEGDGLRFKALKFSSFAEMAEALRNGQIEAAFIIAPLAIELIQQGEDVKVVYIGNRHESTLVARKGLDVNSINDLVGKTVAVPMRYSGHNLSILQMIESSGLEGRIKVVEMNPPDMAAALSTGSLDAYYVGEPFAATTLKSGAAELVHYVEDVWDGFICNLVLVRQDMIDNDPAAVKALVAGAARSGLWAQNNTSDAAEIASKYWNQSLELIKYAMSTPDDRIRFDRFVPVEEEMQYMANLMQHFGLIESNNISGLIDDSFARNVDLQDIEGIESIM
ncbi:MAG: PhnD/SsuA/transferrin family substrate-binding protein [Gammaproteobacteria bacterium]|nr:PhnD/SsuA/transferrin family substrate-binding protein [Gammaproteobacteria bacterium]